MRVKRKYIKKTKVFAEIDTNIDLEKEMEKNEIAEENKTTEEVVSLK